MNELLIKLTLVIFFTCSLTITFSQVKYEKESRINRANVPNLALEFIDALSIDEKIKWYLEESFKGITVEAKFRKNKKNYSIEFDKEGNLQDMEIEIHVSEIQENVKQNIFKGLESEYNKFSIQKIQKQYSGINTEILAFFKNDKGISEKQVKYEIIVNGKTKNTTKQYEIVFDSNGILKSTTEIIQKNANNLEF